jgi:hypothetical protein
MFFFECENTLELVHQSSVLTVTQASLIHIFNSMQNLLLLLLLRRFLKGH